MRSASILQWAAGIILAAFSFKSLAATNPPSCPAGQDLYVHVTSIGTYGADCAVGDEMIATSYQSACDRSGAADASHHWGTSSVSWPTTISHSTYATLYQQDINNSTGVISANPRIADAYTFCQASAPPPPCAQLAIDQNYDHFFSGATLESGCYGGCQISGTGTSVVSIFNQSAVLSAARYTGQACTFGTPDSHEEVQPTTLPDASPGACQGSVNGACISQDKHNCGYVNGEYRCVTDAQLTDDNPCVQTTSGALFCKSDAPDQSKVPTNEDGTKKPADATFNLKKPDGSSTTVNYYGSSTVTSGTQNPGNDSAGPASANGNCGSTTTPCKTKIDETGTPTTYEAPDGPDHDAAVSAISGIGKGHIDTAAGEADTLYPHVLGGQACQTVTYTVLGHSVAMPTAEGCSALHTIRDIFAWLFYLFTAVWIVMRVGKGF